MNLTSLFQNIAATPVQPTTGITPVQLQSPAPLPTPPPPPQQAGNTAVDPENNVEPRHLVYMTPEAQVVRLPLELHGDIVSSNATTTRKKTAYFKGHLDDAVDISKRPQGITTGQFISLVTDWRARNTITQEAYNEMLQIIRVMMRTDAADPASCEECNVPPSKYVMDKVIGVGNAVDLQHHVCVCEKYGWPPFAGDLKAVRNWTCPRRGCGEFRVKYNPRTQKYTPHKSFWYFGLKNAISNYMFANKDWACHRATDAARQNTFYTSRLADKLRAFFGHGLIDNRKVSAYVLGIDGFQPYKYKQHNITVIFLKCLDFADRY